MRFRSLFWPQWIQRAPQPRRMDILWVLIPTLLWVGLYQNRSEWVTLTCLERPEACDVTHINPLDRTFYQAKRDDHADRWSFMTQDSAGWLGLAVPVAVHSARLLAGTVLPGGFLAQLGADVLISIQSVLITGSLTELAKVTVSRPRPYVYYRTKRDGKEPSNYTSFFSGHTSFAGAASMSAALIMVSRWGSALPKFVPLFGLWGLLYWLGWTVSTGYFRVKAGVHFTTDVLVGGLVGSIVALAVAWHHRSRARKAKETGDE